MANETETQPVEQTEERVIEAELPTKATMGQMKELYPPKDWTQKQMNAHFLERLSAVEAHANQLMELFRNLRLTVEPKEAQKFG